MKKLFFLILAATLTTITASAADDSAAVALLKTIGSKQVICVPQGKSSGAIFYVDRNISGDLNVAFFGGELTALRETSFGYTVNIKGENLVIDIGDDSPHDLLQIKLSDLKSMAGNPRSRATGLFYPDDEPSNGSATQSLQCSIQ